MPQRARAEQFVMPHGLTIHLQGNVLLTDVGAQGVRKFTPQAKPLLTLVARGIKGFEPRHFALPTDVAFGSV